MPISVDPQYSVAGFLVGLLVGQTGMGGGALMTPVLILLFGVHPATAVGIDLLYASMTKRLARWSTASAAPSNGASSACLLVAVFPLRRRHYC